MLQEASAQRLDEGVEKDYTNQRSLTFFLLVSRQLPPKHLPPGQLPPGQLSPRTSATRTRDGSRGGNWVDRPP